MIHVDGGNRGSAPALWLYYNECNQYYKLLGDMTSNLNTYRTKMLDPKGSIDFTCLNIMTNITTYANDFIKRQSISCPQLVQNPQPQQAPTILLPSRRATRGLTLLPQS